MKTYEDLRKNNSPEFILTAINDYLSSEMYRNAEDSYNYYCKKNTTIMQFQKFLYEKTGEAIPDNYSANYKLRNSFYRLFIQQEVSHLLGNGVTFQEESTKEALGGDMFDRQAYKACQSARWGGVSYGFLNENKVKVFTALEFVPFYGEEDGLLHAGIRFWRLASGKPLRATLFEADGVTEYLFRKGEDPIVLREKTPYITVVRKSDTGEEVYDQRNYKGFPVVPLWGNDEHQTALEGLKEKIDAYDLIQSGFANDLDEASFFYWTITNAGGMTDGDLAKFIKDMKLLRAAVVDDDGSTAQAHTMDVPFEARKTGLEELRESLYRDAMALDVERIVAGSTTATAIRAAYENLDLKCDLIEMCVTDWINGLLELQGIEDMPNYKRSRIVNIQEETNAVLSAAQYLDEETVRKHLPFLSPDELDTIRENRLKEEAARYEMVRQAAVANGETDQSDI